MEALLPKVRSDAVFDPVADFKRPQAPRIEGAGEPGGFATLSEVRGQDPELPVLEFDDVPDLGIRRSFGPHRMVARFIADHRSERRTGFLFYCNASTAERL